MPKGKKFTLVYTNTFKRHIKLTPAKHHSLIRENLAEQLEYEPEVQTRNRKPLEEPLAFEAEWELRFGPENRFRVFYRVDEQDVVLLALGEKRGNRLWIEGKEVAT